MLFGVADVGGVLEVGVVAGVVVESGVVVTDGGTTFGNPSQHISAARNARSTAVGVERFMAGTLQRTRPSFDSNYYMEFSRKNAANDEAS